MCCIYYEVTSLAQGDKHLPLTVHVNKDSVDPECRGSQRALLPGDLKVGQCAMSVYMRSGCVGVATASDAGTPQCAPHTITTHNRAKWLYNVHMYVRMCAIACCSDCVFHLKGANGTSLARIKHK